MQKSSLLQRPSNSSLSRDMKIFPKFVTFETLIDFLATMQRTNEHARILNDSLGYRVNSFTSVGMPPLLNLLSEFYEFDKK